MTATAENLTALTIRDLAFRIRKDWGAQGKGVNYAAAPYLDAMLDIENITDQYGFDNGKNIVRYFLSNAGSYRGETAKAIKAELKRRLK